MLRCYLKYKNIIHSDFIKSYMKSSFYFTAQIRLKKKKVGKAYCKPADGFLPSYEKVPERTMKAGPMVFELTVSPSTNDFVKTILQKVCSKLIGVATNSFPNFFILKII